jgi:hypothetical protein
VFLIESIQEKVKMGHWRVTIHAFERCVERGISPVELAEVILSGEIIERYPTDKYGPGCLIHGETNDGRILNVQCATNPVWIITAYDPTLSPELWTANFKRRRRYP